MKVSSRSRLEVPGQDAVIASIEQGDHTNLYPLECELLSDGVSDPATERMAHEMIRAVRFQGADFANVMCGHLLDRGVAGLVAIDSHRLEAEDFPVPGKFARSRNSYSSPRMP